MSLEDKSYEELVQMFKEQKDIIIKLYDDKEVIEKKIDELKRKLLLEQVI